MSKRIFPALICLYLIFALLIPVAAQSTRDYAITSIDARFAPDGGSFQVVVVVENQGADASGTAEVEVRLLTGDARAYVATSIAALAANDSVTVPLPFSIADFPAGSEQTIQVTVGVDGFELLNTPIAENNIASVVVQIPENSAPAISTSSTPARRLLDFEGDNIIIFDNELSRRNVVLALAGFAGAVILLWLLTVIGRLLFRGSSRFGTWHPPYGIMPMYDQNSIEGRRQAWQTHAQNGLLLAAPTEGNLHAVKLLLSADAGSLQNWHITALRLSQYDAHGRIGRSQAIAAGKWVKRLNQVLRKRYGVADDQLRKMIRPIAQGLVKQFRKNIRRKHAFLPIVLDIRLEGKQGEVRILFELYQCRGQIWYRLDQWEPTMMVVTQPLQENLSFTIHGKLGNEKLRDFYDRLRDDLIWLLMEMVRVEQPQQQQVEVPHEMFHVPDTLSGMDPIREDSEPIAQ